MPRWRRSPDRTVAAFLSGWSAPPNISRRGFWGDFVRVHPGLELRLVIGNRADMINGLQHCEIDIAVMGRPPQELDVNATVIGDHPHVIIAASDHPLAKLKLITPSRLNDEVFLVREPGSGTRALMEKFFSDNGIAPRIGMQISSNETIKQAVIAGLGIAFISGHTIDSSLITHSLTILPIEGLPNHPPMVYCSSAPTPPDARRASHPRLLHSRVCESPSEPQKLANASLVPAFTLP